MIKLLVSGMNCGACVKKITKVIQSIDEDAHVDVNIAAGTVDIEGVNHDKRFESAIVALGYGVASA